MSVRTAAWKGASPWGASRPAAVATTSTWALTNATLPYVTSLADRGWRGASLADASLARGVSTHGGLLTSEPVADAVGRDWTPVREVLGA